MDAPLTKVAAEQLAAAAYELPSDVDGIYAAAGDLVDILGRVEHISRELGNRIHTLPADQLGVDELGERVRPAELLDGAIQRLAEVGDLVISARDSADQAQSMLSRLYLADGPGRPRTGLHLVGDLDQGDE
jgi:hypothetical protein